MNGESTNFNLCIGSHVNILGDLISDKTIVKIVDSMTSDLFDALKKFNTHRYVVATSDKIAGFWRWASHLLGQKIF